jgi:hypothetical protein
MRMIEEHDALWWNICHSVNIDKDKVVISESYKKQHMYLNVYTNMSLFYSLTLGTIDFSQI